MKIPAILFALAFATIAAAATPADGVKIPSKNGAITFNHSKHKDVKCETCHAKAEGGKIAFTKESGHKLCQDCHKANKAKGALISCKSCHSGPKA